MIRDFQIKGIAAPPQRDYQPEVPNADAYPVDYRIEGKSGIPLFLYGVPNRDEARLTPTMLGYLHRQVSRSNPSRNEFPCARQRKAPPMHHRRSGGGRRGGLDT